MTLDDAHIVNLSFTHNIIHTDLNLDSFYGSLYFGYNIFLEDTNLRLPHEPIQRIISKYNLFDPSATNVYEGEGYIFDETDLLNVDLDHLFGVHNEFVFITWIDREFLLAPDSPAKNIDDEGTEAGPFGGAEPYRLSGLPNIPRIEVLEAPNFATSSGGLPIRVKISAEPSSNASD